MTVISKRGVLLTHMRGTSQLFVLHCIKKKFDLTSSFDTQAARIFILLVSFWLSCPTPKFWRAFFRPWTWREGSTVSGPHCVRKSCLAGRIWEKQEGGEDWDKTRRIVFGTPDFYSWFSIWSPTFAKETLKVHCHAIQWFFTPFCCGEK